MRWSGSWALGVALVSYLMGIDVGTGGTRAIIIDATGRIAGTATEEHVPFASPRTGLGRAGSSRLVAGDRRGGARARWRKPT